MTNNSEAEEKEAAKSGDEIETQQIGRTAANCSMLTLSLTYVISDNCTVSQTQKRSSKST